MKYTCMYVIYSLNVVEQKTTRTGPAQQTLTDRTPEHTSQQQLPSPTQRYTLLCIISRNGKLYQ